jgi:hypothetical protein
MMWGTSSTSSSWISLDALDPVNVCGFIHKLIKVTRYKLTVKCGMIWVGLYA